jgi:HSP20 family protein
MSKLVRVGRGMPFELFPRDLGAFLGNWPWFSGEGHVQSGSWFPIDLVETQEGYRVIAEVPGVPRDALAVSLEANVLSIRVTKAVPQPGEGESVHVRERVFGEFTRSISLPRDIDPENVSAECRDGVLEVTVGKSAQAKPRQIDVRTP